MAARPISDADADVLAYLRRKKAGAETMAARSSEFAEQAAWSVRQFDILISDIETGLHLGEASVEADLRGDHA